MTDPSEQNRFCPVLAVEVEVYPNLRCSVTAEYKTDTGEVDYYEEEDCTPERAEAILTMYRMAHLAHYDQFVCKLVFRVRRDLPVF